MAAQYIYVMKDLTKAYPGGREVLKGITLSFLPDAKIGVLGPNGAGKSTLMRTMAGAEKDSGGEGAAAEGAAAGCAAAAARLEQGATAPRRRRLGRRGRQGRLPLAGAGARPREDRRRERHGRLR